MSDQFALPLMTVGWIILLVVTVLWLIRKKDIEKEENEAYEAWRASWKDFWDHYEERKKQYEELERQRLEELRNSPRFKGKPGAFEHYLHMEEVKRRIDQKNKEKWYQSWHW